MANNQAIYYANQVSTASQQRAHAQPISQTEPSIKELKADLKRCGISQEDWMYYLHPPQTWDYATVSALGLTRGVEIVLTARTTSKPIWLKPNQLGLFKLLRDKSEQ